MEWTYKSFRTASAHYNLDCYLFLGQDRQSPFEEFRPFPATLSQQPLKRLHHHHGNSREYLNFIHHGHRPPPPPHHHHHRGQQQQQQQQQIRRGSLEVNPLKLPTPPPPPSVVGADGQPLKGGSGCVRASQGPLDYCTLRHGKQQRAVQFADQHMERQGSEVRC